MAESSASEQQAKVPCPDAESYVSEPDDSCRDFIMQQTMMRIKDPKKSLDFYSRILGMRCHSIATFLGLCLLQRCLVYGAP